MNLIKLCEIYNGIIEKIVDKYYFVYNYENNNVILGYINDKKEFINL